MGQPKSWESTDGYEEHHKRRPESNGYRDGSRADHVRRDGGGGHHHHQHQRNRAEERSRSDATDNWRDAQPSQQQQRKPHEKGERREASGASNNNSSSTNGSSRPAWADVDIKSDGDVPESRMKNIVEHERLEEQRRRTSEARDSLAMDDAKKNEGAALGTESTASFPATRKGSAEQQSSLASGASRGSRFANLFEKSSTVSATNGAAASMPAVVAENVDASATILSLLQGNGGGAAVYGGGGAGQDRPAISASEIEKAMMATVSTGQHQHPQPHALAQQAHVQRDAMASQQLMAMLQLSGGGGAGGPEVIRGPSDDTFARGAEQQVGFVPPMHPLQEPGPAGAQQQQQPPPPGNQHGLMYQAPPFGHAHVFAPGMYMPMPGMPGMPGMPPPPHMMNGGQMQHFTGMPSPPPPGIYQGPIQGGLPPHPGLMAAQQQQHYDHFYPPPTNGADMRQMQQLNSSGNDGMQ